MKQLTCIQKDKEQHDMEMETSYLYPRAYEMMQAFIISFVINNVKILCGST